MATGPEHYRAAEQLALEAATRFQGPDYRHERAEKLAAAQVHATLALAAATAMPAKPYLTTEYRDRLGLPWVEAAG